MCPSVAGGCYHCWSGNYLRGGRGGEGGAAVLLPLAQLYTCAMLLISRLNNILYHSPHFILYHNYSPLLQLYLSLLLPNHTHLHALTTPTHTHSPHSPICPHHTHLHALATLTHMHSPLLGYVKVMLSLGGERTKCCMLVVGW